jgi:hypothetical protein
MELLILLLCIPVGLVVFAIGRAILVPLTSRIPTGREYQPTLTGAYRASSGRPVSRLLPR